MTLTKLLSASFVLAGIALITGLVVYYGAGEVLRALTSVSPGGFCLYIAVQLAITAGLALSWRMLLHSRRRGSFRLLLWGRLVRDAAGEFLPFSQVGGYVLGARVIALGGVSPTDAAASTLADVTTEFLSQIVFVGIGLTLLARRAPANFLLLPIGLGLCGAVVTGIGLVVVQRGGGSWFRRVLLRVAGRAAKSAVLGVGRLQTSLDVVYAEPGRLTLAAAFHLVCWFGTATASFVGFHALHVPLSFADAVIIESLLHAIMALAFFVPGRVGIQEAAYTVLAGVFGIAPEIAISLSLLRRARDFVIAVPVLLAWQGLEASRLRTPA